MGRNALEGFVKSNQLELHPLSVTNKFKLKRLEADSKTTFLGHIDPPKNLFVRVVNLSHREG